MTWQVALIVLNPLVCVPLDAVSIDWNGANILLDKIAAIDKPETRINEDKAKDMSKTTVAIPSGLPSS